MRKLLALSLFLAWALPASAAHLFYAASAQGSNNGTSCANAYIWSDATNGFNTLTAQTAGNILTFCDIAGTYTFAANAQPFQVAHAGSSGNVITVNTSGSPVFSAPYFNGQGAFDITASYITMNLANATAQNTQNGTGLTYEQPSSLLQINGPGVTNVIVENGTFSDGCQVTATDSVKCGGGQDIFIGGGVTNITITKNIVHDAEICVNYSGSSGDSGITISSNTLYRCNWEIGATISSGTTTGLTIDSNDITCVAAGVCNWDFGVGDHHNGIMIDPQGGLMQTIQISNNFIHDVNGTSVTAYVFFDPVDTDAREIGNTLAFNNILYTTPGQSGPGNGMLQTGCGAAYLCQIYNNTAVGATGAQGAYTGEIQNSFYNNIASGTASGIALAGVFTSTNSNYNDFYNLTSNFCVMSWGGFSPCAPTVADWQKSVGTGGTGLDGNSILTNPQLTAGFALNAGSPTIGTGTNLTSLGIAGLDVGAPATFGAGGSCGAGCVARSATNPWDMGAYPSGSSPPPASTGSYIGQGTFIGKGSVIR